MSLPEVNDWLHSNYIDSHISDEDLKETYLQNNTVKKNIQALEDVLKKNNVTNRQISNITRSYFGNLIPDEIRMDIRERTFNVIVRRNVSYPEKNKDCDWYIKDENDGLILGFNYPHLFSGEKQFQKLKRNVYREERTINVLCNFHQFKEEDKLFEVIRDGIMKGNICYYDKITDLVERIN